jgi:preprotein translocase subunit YajC
VTSGGIYGTIRGLDEESLDLEVARGIVLRVARGAIAQRLGPIDEIDELEDPTEDGAGDDRSEGPRGET